MMKTIVAALILSSAMLLFFWGSEAVFAHNVQVFAYTEGAVIKGEALVGGGKKAVHADISVLNAEDSTTLLTTSTDNDGTFSFAIDALGPEQTGDLLIVLDAGPGHRAQWLLKAADFRPGGADNKPKTVQPAVPETINSATADLTVDEAHLRRLIAEVVKEQLGPLKQMILEQQIQAPGVKEILGGLGYIIGISGIIAYLAARKYKKREP